MLAASLALARALRPFLVRLQGVEGRDEPFRCLFARAAADEPLLSAHRAAARAFGRAPDPEYFPHLSLVYGTLPPDVKAGLTVDLVAEAAVAFEAGSLHAWRTAGPVGHWREIGLFRLPGRKDTPASLSGDTGGAHCRDR